MSGGGLDRWIAGGDLDELLREVDRCCDRGDWDRLLVLRDRSRAATERGHQLWPAASFAEYRMALDAPAAWAGTVVRDGTGFLAAGPLTEVVAQHHTWAELEPHLVPGPWRSLVAQERVLRGEVVDTEVVGEPAGDGLPGRLLAWEPGYPLAEYRPDAARFPAPAITPPREPVTGGRVLRPASEGSDGARALEEVVRHWAAHSDGRVRSVALEGTAADALATLQAGSDGPGTTLRRCPVSAADAAALLAWSAASGGARGRRRGMATGRFEAWWALAVLTACEDRWPVDPGPAAEELRYWVWAPDEAPVGWTCRLAVEDPADGLAWVLDATDRA